MEPGVLIADRFELVRRAGGGSMGLVFEARDRVGGSRVALKFMRTVGPKLAERFLREARLLAKLSHPNIVRYVDHGQTAEGDFYLAMEWLEGEVMSARLARKGFTVEEAMVLARALASGLASAHRHGIVHRDIKPGNLFLAGDDVARMKILDFGVMRLQAERGLTAEGIRIGTLGYMAPEQARGEPTVDARADVFSVGCVLFECLAGRPAFAGEHEVAVLAKTLMEQPPALRALKPSAPPALEALLETLLAKRASERPADGSALLALLDGLGPLDGSAPPPVRPQRPGLTADEQRLLSVVLAGRIDTVASQDSILPTLILRTDDAGDAVANIAAEHQALVERLANGAFVLTLHGTGAAQDLAARAARCSLSLRSVLHGTPVALATGRGELDVTMPGGEVIDRAVQTLREGEQATYEGSYPVYLDATTARLLGARFEVEAVGDRRELRRERHETEAAERPLLGRPSPFVGRRRELGFLAATYEECVEERAPRVVLLSGAPGSGKTRLLKELFGQLAKARPRPEVWLGRGNPTSTGSPFVLIASALRGALGLRDGESAAVQRGKILSRVREVLTAGQSQRVAEFLGELVGVPFPDDQRPQLRLARRDPVVRGDQMRLASEEFLAGAAGRRPILIAFDDVQWGDQPSLQLVDSALRNLADRPVLVVGAGRPELHERFPRLWDMRDVQRLRLGGLGRAAATRLVLSAIDDCPADRLGQMVERAQGSPLYLEELIRAEAESPGGPLPETILAMAQSRIEQLEELARQVLRAASVFGPVFWVGGVAALLGPAISEGTVREWLTELAERELIAARDLSQFGGEEELAFRSDVLRVAAYSMLTPRDRAKGHRLAAKWLEEVGDSDAVRLATHYEQGEHPRRAIAFWRRAAEQALAGDDLAAVVGRAERGIENGAEADELGRLRLVQAEAERWRGELDRALRLGVQALFLLPAGQSVWFRAVGELAAIAGQLGERTDLLELLVTLERTQADEAASAAATAAWAVTALNLLEQGEIEKGERALDRARLPALPDGAAEPNARARLAGAQATWARLTGDLGGALSHLESATAHFEASGDLRGVASQRLAMGCLLSELGSHDSATVILGDTLAHTDRMGIRGIAACARHNLGLVLARQGHLAEGRSLVAAAMDTLATSGGQRGRAGAWLQRSLIELWAHEPGAARHHAEEALKSTARCPSLRAYAQASLGRAHLMLGDPERSISHLSSAMQVVDKARHVEEGEAFIRLAYAEALFAAGRRDEARAALHRAGTRLRERADRIQEAALRASFLGQVSENERTLALLSEWR